MSHPAGAWTSEHVVEEGILSGIAGRLSRSGFSRCHVITEARVAEAWRPALEQGLAGFEASWTVLPGGQATKSLETATRLYGELLALGVDRQTPLLSLGGGTLGDLTGFVAATLLRGLPYAQVPTTLLAMVDASLGGKTGVDLPQGKNLVGAFHPPFAVWADPRTLDTLPLREWAGGIVEALKAAIVASPDLFERVEALPPEPILWSREERTGLIEAAAAVKLEIVQADPLERGARAWLNLGHTLGHALESASGEEGLSHGEAVALGLLAAVRLSRRLGLLEEDLEPWLVAILKAWDLPRAIPAALTWGDVEPFLAVDKKRRGGALVFILPRRIGAVEQVAGVPLEAVRAVFEELLQGGRGPGFG